MHCMLTHWFSWAIHIDDGATAWFGLMPLAQSKVCNFELACFIFMYNMYTLSLLGIKVCIIHVAKRIF